jgi:glycosyltransferase involved in cell wall biosynthesis
VEFKVSHAAILIPGLDRIGGAERQAMLRAKALRRRGWRVSMVTLSGTGGVAAPELRDAGVEFLSLEMRKGLADPRGWIRFHRWLWRERPDIVHAHLPHAAWLARWSRLAAPVPVLIDTLHSSYTGTWGRRLGYRASRWLTDHVTAVSQAAAASHLAARMVSRDKLSVMGNGIEFDAWRPDASARIAARNELGLAGEFLWLAVGRLEAVKDYPTLLNAFARVPETARLLIAGAGPLLAELTPLAARLGLEHRVRFLGFEPHVKRWMQAADGFVLTSRYEGLPMVLIEAGACGLPAIATDVAGTREVIVNGETGWLASAGDAGALAKTMTKLMRTSEQKRRAMCERARRHVAQEFAMEAVLDRWEKLYADLISRKSARWRILVPGRSSSRCLCRLRSLE